MNLNDLFQTQQIDPRNVLVLRHRPHEPELRKVLPWLAAEKPAVFNAYQQTQGERLECVMDAMVGSGLVASFIGHEPGKALFVGLYSIVASKPLTYEQFWKVPAYVEMKAFGMKGWVRENSDKTSKLWFDLKRRDFYEPWQGKLVVSWPPPERSWWRRAHRNEIPVSAILEESALASAMPEWNEVKFTWADLGILPTRWRSALAQWRGIYYIFDRSDGKGYVGSAYGEANLLGRWRHYGARGHGGNALLRLRNPENFLFTILQRVSPDMDAADIIKLESSWKQRLHTRQPYGLNDN
jgi:hypothetical protein